MIIKKAPVEDVKAFFSDKIDWKFYNFLLYKLTSFEDEGAMFFLEYRYKSADIYQTNNTSLADLGLGYNDKIVLGRFEEYSTKYDPTNEDYMVLFCGDNLETMRTFTMPFSNSVDPSKFGYRHKIVDRNKVVYTKIR